MPYEGIPVGRNKHGTAAGPENAEGLGKRAIDVRNILSDLRAGNIKRCVGLSNLGRITDSV
jgi:hypothetical protein